MKSDIQIAAILIAVRERHAIVKSVDISSDVKSVHIEVDKNFKEIEIDGRIILRGPHLCKKLAETLTNITGDTVAASYSYVDQLPDKEEYIQRVRQNTIRNIFGDILPPEYSN